MRSAPRLPTTLRADNRRAAALMSSPQSDAIEPARSGLREHFLTSAEVAGQSIANDGPSLAIAVGVGLVAVNAGAGATVVFIAATVAIVLVAVNIGYVASRLASAGSLYEYVRSGIGPGPGFMTGWVQLLGYLCGAMFPCIAMFVYLRSFLADLNVAIAGSGWAALVVLAGAALAMALAYRSIRWSTRAQLALEIVSVSVIAALGVVVLVKHGATFDSKQFEFSKLRFHGLVLGFPLAILSFVGFESSASLGVEADRPYRSIPRAVVGTALGIGVFFIVLSYVQLAGFDGFHGDIASSAAPLNDLANHYGVSALGTIISAGIVCSCFGIVLACLNAASRIALTMSHDGLLPELLARTHAAHGTPTVGVVAGATVIGLVPAGLILAGDNPTVLLDDTGELTAMALLVAYLLLCVAVPVYLYRTRSLTATSAVVGTMGTLAVTAMLFGQLDPLPPSPVRWILLAFAGYLIVGLGVFAVSASARRSSVSPVTTEEAVSVARR